MVTVIVALLLLIFVPRTPSCQYTDKKPSIDTGNVELLKNLNSNTLVQAAGYIKYNGVSDSHEAEKKYLPLSVARVQVDEEKNSDNVAMIKLSMISDCFNFGIEFSKHDSIDTTNTAVSQLSLQLTTPSGGQARCSLSYPVGLYFSYGRHYKCWEERAYPCYGEQKDPEAKAPLVATLALSAFEFEVGAKPEDVRAGSYSTPGTDECPF